MAVGDPAQRAPTTMTSYSFFMTIALALLHDGDLAVSGLYMTRPDRRGSSTAFPARATR
jgi:hypothetical protein